MLETVFLHRRAVAFGRHGQTFQESALVFVHNIP
jgi:hypothetical protein